MAIGDKILAVNNKKTENLTHQEVVDLLRNAGQHIHLKIQYKIPTPGKAFRLHSKLRRLFNNGKHEEDQLRLTKPAFFNEVYLFITVLMC